jgi:hypothetical protein
MAHTIVGIEQFQIIFDTHNPSGNPATGEAFVNPKTAWDFAVPAISAWQLRNHGPGDGQAKMQNLVHDLRIDVQATRVNAFPDPQCRLSLNALIRGVDGPLPAPWPPPQQAFNGYVNGMVLFVKNT